MENDLASTLVALIHDFSRSLRQEFACRHDKQCANILQTHTLFLLEERKGMTMKEFAEAMHISSPSATTFVDRLILLKWARRLVDPKNRKLVRLSLTATGKRVLEHSNTTKSTIIRQCINRVSPEDQQHLLRILRQFVGKDIAAH